MFATPAVPEENNLSSCDTAYFLRIFLLQCVIGWVGPVCIVMSDRFIVYFTVGICASANKLSSVNQSFKQVIITFFFIDRNFINSL